MHEVFLESSAQRDLKRLGAEQFRRITARIKGLAEDPRRAGCRKIVGAEHDWRIRVGDYRIVYEIDDKASAVRVMRVKHRREAYG